MDFTSYQFIPVKPGGRDREGLDCWGLVALIYKEMRGIDLPLYENVNWRDSREVWLTIAAQEKLNWCPVAVHERAAYDVVVLRLKGIPWHVGVLVDHNRFIHADPLRGIHIERLNAIHWKSRVEGCFRLKGEENAVPAAA